MLIASIGVLVPTAGSTTAVLAHATPDNMPPPLTTDSVWTAWTFEPLPLIAVALVTLAYLWGVARLRASGVGWAWWRTVFFLMGIAVIVLGLASALATYDTVLLSVHMIQHMLLAMVAPIFLAVGAPITLALRTFPKGPRSVLLAVMHSRWARFITNPLVAGTIFVLNPFILYYTGLYDLTLRNAFVHDVNHVHFILVGCLWYFPLLGVDPMPRRMSYPVRLIAVFATMPFHAVLGLGLMEANPLTGEEWYFSLPRDWGPAPIVDQKWAGGMLWVTGEVVALIVFAILFVQWMASSEREAKRQDRHLDRAEETGGGDLAALNASLAAMASEDERRARQ